jgi:hypothetical protein
MHNATRLTIVKLVHTVIWLFYNVVIFYLLYAVITDRIDHWVWICIGLILLEVIVLLIFRVVCPITIIARRYTTSTADNFDIYLPLWLARYNKQIYSVIVIISLVILAVRLLT